MKGMCFRLQKKSQSITNILIPTLFILFLLLLWESLSRFRIVDPLILPSFTDTIKAFIGDFKLLMNHLGYTLLEAFLGLSIGIALAFILSLLMDNSDILYKCFKPIIVLTQTVPSVAIAPLLILWFGYDMTPKVILIVIITFFPIAIGLLDAFKNVNPKELDFFKSMNASRFQIYRYLKLPSARVNFFSGLKISLTYSIVGAVISEWLGGFHGLGVYMIRVKKAYAFDKMFAAIMLISVISLLLMALCELLKKHFTKYLD